MIKKTMYFYDEKQANLIKKVNDKLHRQRGVKVTDSIINDIKTLEKQIDNIRDILFDMKPFIKGLTNYIEKGEYGNTLTYIKNTQPRNINVNGKPIIDFNGIINKIKAANK